MTVAYILFAVIVFGLAAVLVDVTLWMRRSKRVVEALSRHRTSSSIYLILNRLEEEGDIESFHPLTGRKRYRLPTPKDQQP